MTEDAFPSSQRKLAVGCVGSRTTILGITGRVSPLSVLISKFFHQSKTINTLESSIVCQSTALMVVDKGFQSLFPFHNCSMLTPGVPSAI